MQVVIGEVKYMIYGNVEGVRNSQLNELETIYDIKVDRNTFISQEILDKILKATLYLEREVSVAIDRKGNVISVAVGDSTSVEIPILDIKEKKLSGVRVIHSHPNGISRLSALDNSALLRLKLDAIVALGIYDNSIKEVTMGFCSVKNNILEVDTMGPMTLEQAFSVNILSKIAYSEELIRNNEVLEDQGERAIIVGCDGEDGLDELEELSKACNIPVVERVYQNRNKIDTAFYIGSGKVEEIGFLVQGTRANVAIFDDELSGSQVRNLEEALGVKVIDRTTLILEIFARRAKSREAKIQVELAQLKYRQTRLSGLGTVLSRTGGGIGTRGPGEKKLEIDRRHIKERIYDLNEELKKVKRNRETQRERRNKNSIPQVSLVGYTNAGKSTLRNKLCEMAATKEGMSKEKVFEADMLFATLDITTRAITLKDNRVITLTDTVGFVKKLPHDLVEAFKSTLEEVVYSDLLVHVVDASSLKAKEEIIAVENVLGDLGARDKSQILVFNKIDVANKEHIEVLKDDFSNYNILEISAKEGTNLEELLKIVGENLPNTLREEEFIIPYDKQSMVSFLHRNSKVLIEEYKEEGTYIKAILEEEAFNKCREFLVRE